MHEYQQVHRAHEPKDKRMSGYEVTIMHMCSLGYEDAGM